jgi:NADH-quinone oxidoreductase subunit N
LVMAILSFTIIILVTTKDLIPKFLINWRLLSSYNLWFSSLFAIVLLSLAGIPPLAGFYMKLAAILALLDQEYLLTLCLTSIIILKL